MRDPDPKAIGRAFSGAAIELALASYPGFHVTAPPGDAEPYGVFDRCLRRCGRRRPRGGARRRDVERHVEPPPQTQELDRRRRAGAARADSTGRHAALPLGTVAGARSGDKGGSANVGVWVRTDDAWRWLANALTVDELRRLLPEVASLPVTRHVLPNLRAVNFVIDGLLGDGVASNARFDPQAKALGEWLRSRHVDIPEALL